MTSVERVIERRPDLIVADLEANRKAIADLMKVAELRGKLFVVRQSGFADLFRSIASIGTITGCNSGARRVVRGIRSTLDDVRRRVQRLRHRPAVVFVVEVQPLWVAGDKTFIGEMVEAAGGRNAARQMGEGYRSMSVESLMALNPEVILSTHATVDELRTRPGWSRVSAVQKGRVYRLGFEAVRPCPRLGSAVRQLFELLHRP